MMVPLLLVGLLTHWQVVESTSLSGGDCPFALGILGPMTSVSQRSLAVAVAFDIDFRKNVEPDLVARFGQPIIQIPNIHPDLCIASIIGSDNSDGKVAIKAVSEWATGMPPFPAIRGLVGSYHSFVSWRIATTAEGYDVPQVAWGATSQQLSENADFPYFSRTIPSDANQVVAWWSWMNFFNIPSILFWYTSDAYGENLFEEAVKMASNAGQSYRVLGLAMEPTYVNGQHNTSSASRAAEAVRIAASHIIVMAMSASEGTNAMWALEEAGLLYDGVHEILGFDQIRIVDTQPQQPSAGLPVGFQKFMHRSRGPLFSAFADLWTKMTTQDIYSTEARQRYMLDAMQVQLEAGASPMLTDADFQSAEELDSSDPFLFDATYVYVYAINSLLNQGLAPDDIRGERLLEEIRKTSFEGLTGNVSFGTYGDRAGSLPMQLWNTQVLGANLMVKVAEIDMSTGAFHLGMNLTWSNGDIAASPPEELLACNSGFVPDVSTGACNPCTPGTGCGYRKEIGFPLGVIGPFDVTSSFMASAVLFDLDFRKNFDPEIRARFGPPIVNITNLHPELRIKLQIGTSDFSVSTGMETALDWFLGLDGFDKVAGVVGSLFSFVTGPIAQAAAIFQVPQISYGATNPDFSSKLTYPYFLRTVPPDTLQGSATWAWMQYYGVPSASYAHSLEGFGEGLFNTVAALARADGSPGRIISIGMEPTPSGEAYDVTIAFDACDKIIAAGSKVVFMTFASGEESNGLLYAMQNKSMLGRYQILGEGTVSSAAEGYVPSPELMAGNQFFSASGKGPLFSEFEHMWSLMASDDVLSQEARSRYMSDRFLGGRVGEYNFTQMTPSTYNGFLFDACYTFVVAINKLLNSGRTGEEILGEILLEEVRNTSFNGVSGSVSYNEFGDRASDYILFSVDVGGLGVTQGAIWSSESSEFTFLSSSKEVLWAGGRASASIPVDLVACSPGQRWDADLGFCIACTINSYSTGGIEEEAVCQTCDAGWVSNLPSRATECSRCPEGFYRTIQDENCIACPPGMFGAEAGQSACEECAVGSFSNDTGKSSCDLCGAGRATSDLFTTLRQVEVHGDVTYNYLEGATSESDCGCDRATRRDAQGECISCTEGMICKGKNDVSIEEGYYATEIVNAELSIFKCHGLSERCVGGIPGSTCAEGRTGVTCAECSDGTTESGASCKPCNGSDRGPLVLLIIIAIVSLFALYHLIDTQNRATQSYALLLCSCAMSQLITVSQHLGVVGLISVDWQEPIRSLMLLLGTLTFNLEVLRINCVSSLGPVSRFSLKVSMVFACIGLVLLVHAFFVICRHKGKFGQQIHTLLGAIGTLFMVFNIAVTSTVLQPLQCQEHPNDKWTVRTYPSVICWDSSDHTTMLVVGCFVFLAVPVTCIVAATIIVRQFPARMRAGDAKFLKAFSFLFFRFRPTQHSYILTHMLKSMAISMVLVVPEPILQVLFLEIVMLIGFSISLHYLPWRVASANFLDCLVSSMTLIIVFLASMFIPDEDKDGEVIAYITFCIVLSIVLLPVMAVSFGVYKRYFRFRKPFQFFLCHHKVGSGAYTRLLKMILLESPKVLTDVFVDSDNLDNLDKLFDYVRNDTGTLIVMCTEEIFCRPWCVGEMCAARLKKVKTIVAALPGAELPDDKFISEVNHRIVDIHILVESGMTYDMLKDTFLWIREQVLIRLPLQVNIEVVSELVDRLVSSKAHQQVEAEGNIMFKSPKRIASGFKQSLSVLIYDRLNLEAAATANVLKHSLTPLMSHQTDMVPEVVESPSNLPPALNAALMVCTNGAFERVDVAQVLLEMSKIECSFVPLICERSFRFPSKNVEEQLVQSLPSGFDAAEIRIIGQVTLSLFKEIAINFDAQHMGEAHLTLAAKDISRRMLSQQSKSGAVRSAESSLLPLPNLRAATKELVAKKSSTSSSPTLRNQSSTRRASSDSGQIREKISEQTCEIEQASVMAETSAGSADNDDEDDEVTFI